MEHFRHPRAEPNTVQHGIHHATHDKLYSKLYPRLDQKQAEDQAGFRSSYQTTDHFATYRLIEQKCHEWGINNRLHKSIRLHYTQINLESPRTCGIEHDYNSLLKKIYRDQKASVQTDEESNMFEIKKGSDPLSSLLFNMVLQKSLKKDIQRWQKKKGICDKDHDCLINLRFADDVLLFASSKGQLQRMLCKFKRSTEKVGLRIHPEKTKIPSSRSSQSSDTKKEMEVDDINIEILTTGESVRYLGQTIYLPATGDDRNQEPYQGCLGNIPQV